MSNFVNKCVNLTEKLQYLCDFFFVIFQEASRKLLMNTGGRVDLAVEYLQRLEGVQPYLNNAVGRKAYIQVKIFLKYSFYFFYFSNLMYSIFSG